MERRGTSDRHLAASCQAMVFAMGQANLVFPLMAPGLNLGRLLALSILGGRLGRDRYRLPVRQEAAIRGCDAR